MDSSSTDHRDQPPDSVVPPDSVAAPTMGSGQVPAPERRRWAVQAALVGVAALLVVGAGVTVWPDRHDAFCERVAALPSIAQLGDDGTPAAALRSSAAAYGRLADAAPDEAVAAAARTLATHQWGLADAVAGASSSSEVVGQVEVLDESDLDGATRTLDDEIARHCG